VTGLEAAGVKFRSITEEINTGSAGGRLQFHIFGALAEFERSLIRERTLAGLQAARARGRKGGRPSKLSAEDLEVAERLLGASFSAQEVDGCFETMVSRRFLAAAVTSGSSSIGHCSAAEACSIAVLLVDRSICGSQFSSVSVGRFLF
jgi:hypothetical protein